MVGMKLDIEKYDWIKILVYGNSWWRSDHIDPKCYAKKMDEIYVKLVEISSPRWEKKIDYRSMNAI